MSEKQMSPDDRLIYMANQIARNFALGHEAAADAVADHIMAFWDPRMKSRIKVMLADRRETFSLTAAAAIERLQAGVVMSQTPATEFNAVGEDGHCDAG